jgi:hypothetical protein
VGHDYGGPSLRYADRYDITGALDEDLEAMFDDGASKDDIVLWLHEIAMFDEEDEAREQWRVQHPIKHAVLVSAGTTNVGQPAVEGEPAMTNWQHHRTRLWLRTSEAEEAGRRTGRSRWRRVLSVANPSCLG